MKNKPISFDLVANRFNARDRKGHLLRLAIFTKYSTIQEFADSLGVTRGCVSQVIWGFYRSAMVETALADLVGVDAERLFPKEAAA